MKNRFPSGWFRDISIAKKLYFTVGIMAVLIAVELFTLFFSISTLSSLRAYVGGEGLWSKAQKDAIYQLIRYGKSRNEEDYAQYQQYMKVPLGDNKARLELLKPNPDMQVAREGFIEGRNHPEDVDGMIRLFRRFHNVSYIHNAIAIWTEAVPYAQKLMAISDSLHHEINATAPSQERIDTLLAEIAPLNKNLTVLEDNFSYTLGEGSRWLEGLVLKLLFSIALTVEITGLLLAISVSRGIQKGLNEIIEAGKSFAQGNFGARARAFSKDEIGVLANTFNYRSEKFEQSIAEMEQAQKKFKGLLESAPDAIVIVDKSGVVKLVNSQTEKLFGFKREEILERPVEILIPFRFANNHHGHRSHFFENPKTRNMGEGMELFGRKNDGSEFPVEISLSPLETDEGTLVSAAIRDITERKEIEAQLKEYNKELEVKNSELEQFAYVASHDLQEPLRTVISFVELLQKEHSGRFTEKEMQYMNYIIESAHRMKWLIKDLLEYSRIGRNKELEQVDCNVIVCEVIADLDAAIKASNATINAGKLPVLTDYETDVKLLFQNLVNNAVKFRKPGTKPVVDINAEQLNGVWKFSVKDNGIGISPKYYDRIFIIFQRLHNRKEYEGTGIGLAHCKKIVEMRGGAIWVESEEGKGSTFFFTYPNKIA
jgi:PAS domain S-box-containing protein